MKRPVSVLALVSAAAVVVVVVVVAGALSLRGALADGEGPAPVVAARAVDPRDVRVGELVPDVALTLADGTSKPLSALSGKRGLLVVARSETCPVGRRYGVVLAGIEGEAAKAGVNVVYVNVEKHVQKGADATTAAAAAKDYGFAAPYAIDATRAAATALRLRSTTEVVLLDAARTVVYRGAVDDQFAVGLMRDAARETWLRDALKALAAGKRPHVEATTAPGCALDLDAPAAPAETPAPSSATVAPSVTWHNRISRIVDRNCAECHRAGENGPFPLVTLADVKAQSEMVQVVVQDRTMPPWFAADVREHAAEGGAAPRREACPPMGSDQRLSERDRADFLAWLKGGMPAGDAKDAAIPLVRETGWRIGTPDLVLEVENEFDVPATGTVEYQYRWVKASFPEDRWVRGFEVRVSSPEVVHHVLVFARNRGKKKQGIFDGGLTGFFAAMVPGSGSVLWPEGMAKRLPAETDLYFQIHYTPNGKPAKDRPKIGLVFAKEPPREEVKTRGVFDMKFVIPPGAARHEVRATWSFPDSGRILEFMPHMHLRGTAFRYELETPDGVRTTLLEIPRYDFNWQLVYRLREPVVVERGAKIIATGWFDNSAKNPANPDPAATVRFGEQTYEEMMIGYVDWVPSTPPAPTPSEK